MDTQIATLTDRFTTSVLSFVDSAVDTKVRDILTAALGGSKPAKTKKKSLSMSEVLMRLHNSDKAEAKKMKRTGQYGLTRKKMPVQLCPVPGCKDNAAPIFGMLCTKHKNTTAKLVHKYREARKEMKAKEANKANKPAVSKGKKSK